MVPHTVSSYDEELRSLLGRVTEMAGIVESMVGGSVRALLRGDSHLAEEMRSLDKRVDDLDSAVEDAAVLMIAKRQPMGDDLRTIVSSMRVSQDLERVGDLAKNIAKRALALSGTSIPRRLAGGVEHLADLAVRQLSSAVDAMANGEADLAVKVWENDDEIDALYTSLFRELLTYMMEDPRNISTCTHLLFCAKNMERIGDHATNIAERAYYMQTGEQLTGDRPKLDTVLAEGEA